MGQEMNEERKLSYEGLVKEYQIETGAMANQLIFYKAKETQLLKELEVWEEQSKTLSEQIQALQQELEMLKQNNQPQGDNQ
ncbi:hypothetical protein [Enterococcus sp. N249-2]